MNHLDAAKTLVAQHAAATNQVLALLNDLTANGAQATQAAVSAASAELQGANDVLTAQINASMAQLQEIIAQYAGVAPPAPQPAPAPVV